MLVSGPPTIKTIAFVFAYTEAQVTTNSHFKRVYLVHCATIQHPTFAVNFGVVTKQQVSR